MQDDLSGGGLGGEVEVDETFIGGKARNMHKDRKARVQKDSLKHWGILGMLLRGGTVRATPRGPKACPLALAPVPEQVERFEGDVGAADGSL